MDTRMRPYILPTIILSVGLTLTGCNTNKGVVYKDDSTTAQAAPDGSSMRISDVSGMTTFYNKATDLKKFGIPIYPGARSDQLGSTSSEGKLGVMRTAGLVTKDPFEKVYGWYKARMPAGAEQMSFNNSAAFNVQSRSLHAQALVMITSIDHETDITLTAQHS